MMTQIKTSDLNSGNSKPYLQADQERLRRDEHGTLRHQVVRRMVLDRVPGTVWFRKGGTLEGPIPETAPDGVRHPQHGPPLPEEVGRRFGGGAALQTEILL